MNSMPFCRETGRVNINLNHMGTVLRISMLKKTIKDLPGLQYFCSILHIMAQREEKNEPFIWSPAVRAAERDD